MKFRNGLNYKVEPLKTYELELPKEDVIYRLREQDGYCRNESSGNQTLEFTCSKKGDMLLSETIRYKEHHVFLQGETVTENGKTLVKVFTVKRRGLLFDGIFEAVCSLIVIVFYFWIMLKFLKDIGPSVWIAFALLVAITPISLIRIFKKRKAVPTDTEIMIKEIDQRILGVIKWDE